ncbi:nickel pincer cofactor biosynthesis protein LarC [Desulfotalea psychrophila]|uniref:Putative nickel insertion protein n=1 Tax=Desulfotalea psychrophila (strain LSv54 / DSM 12343) TaxID=177439 RepID=Y748_DESPS|nr:nickel pincer cofactor biosynthesis protein LarC [Desulfotalea psychrophila]Q6AQ96.1 RecName: Full=Putative nickel insertion protein [Desulfotalea psychrophila LSv54]CAG35477.1 conserved hypothetical protein [Desulfotalea psychrophila LSv54]
MSRICYLDCFSGVSGDMLLGAFLDAGVEVAALEAGLAALHLDDLILRTKRVEDCGLSAIKVDVDSSRRQNLRTLPDLLRILQESDLSSLVQERAALVFTAIASAEAKVHGTSLEQVHFHEIGALDTIADVVGVVLCLELLQIDQLVCSPLPQPRGFIDCAHGRIPLPAPAVCEILRGVPSYGVALEQELVTPTGAALVKALVGAFGQFPPMQQLAVGYGAGSQRLANGQPNLLRIFVGTPDDVLEEQQVEVIETNLDDWNPESYPYLCERLFEHGALDVSLAPIQMKKGRPGFCLQVIAGREDSAQLKDIVLLETTALGLRFRFEYRRTLPRRELHIESPWGTMRVKEVQRGGRRVIIPEYEECRRVAGEYDLPLQEVYGRIQGLNFYE